jgi:hypothetical protein
MNRLLRIAFLSVAVMLVQGTWALAGVTGTANGTVLVEGTNAPVAQAKVTASSASQTSTATTDNSGHFGFVSLVPDTYTFTASKEGVIEPLVQRGVTVLADQVASVLMIAKPFVKTIGLVTARASSDLVRPGTTANVYSVNAAGQARTSMLGGGGGGDQGYSAIAALPGAYVPPGQAGWFQDVYIRGGDYDQVGYEFDGVPVNRSFDNYPTTNLSALGQQELQLYTGAAPASAESQGLAGYINQVIKSGTYPGFGSVNLGVGTPNLYNKANIEFGGATPNRNFSYYVGVGLVNYDPRFIDSHNGASYTQTAGSPFDLQNNGPAVGPLGGCQATDPTSKNFTNCYNNAANPLTGAPGLGAGPGGYYMGPFPMGGAGRVEDRENVFNFHFGIPHKGDAGKDDIQLLYDVFQLYQFDYSSVNDWGGPQFYNNDVNSAIGVGNTFVSGRQYMPGVGGVFTSADPTQAANVANYSFPSAGGIGLNGPIPQNQRDTSANSNAIYKLQWQHNIGTSSYLRLYGYIFYSSWNLYGPNSSQANFVSCCPADYELWTHTRGGSAQYVNQLSPKHLLNVEGSYSTASTVRDNNTQPFQAFGGSRTRMAVLVDSLTPNNGLCYKVGDVTNTYSCEPAVAAGGPLAMTRATWLTYACVQGGGTCGNGFTNPGVGIPAPPATCGVTHTDQCGWLVAENGPWATFNTVTPRFWAASLQDTWKPNDRLNLNIGVRDDVFTYVYTPTGGGTRPFEFNAWNQSQCVNPLFNGGTPFDMTSGTGGTNVQSAGTSCGAVFAPGFPAGSFSAATLVNSTANGGQVTFNEFEPRFGGTYTFGVDDVLRFSAGRYVQPGNAAFEQYNSLDQNLPNHLLGPLFYKFGYNTPNHVIRPSVSYNYDLSFEHRFANTQTSFKLTPFLRETSDQVQQIFIDPKTAFVSGLNAGKETNEGVEFLLSMGNFNNNGWAGQLSYTYTYSRIKYAALPNGGTVLDQDNADIQKYNSYTQSCVGAVASSSPSSLCGPTGGTNAVQCFNSANGMPDPTCSSALPVSNPYFKAMAQSLFNPNASYTPYDIVPSGVQLSSQGYVVPNVATLVVQYKRDKWSFVPAFQFHTGSPYGAPEVNYGFNPQTCTQLAGGVIGTDPRYPAGSAGPPADAQSCTGSLVIPNTYTGKFDNIGAFIEPSELNIGAQIGYEATSRVAYTVNLANIVNTCFGGTKAAWTLNDSHVCGYGVLPGFIPPVGNFYNPGATIQQVVKYPYFPFSSTNGLQGFTVPFSATFNVQVKL